MITHLLRLLLALPLVVLCSVGLRAEPLKLYVFGNSLIHHLTSSDETTVPFWLSHFAQNGGESFALDGQWGLMLRDYPGQLPPDPQWQFEGVTRAWTQRRAEFADIGYDAVIVNPSNFIQYEPPEEPYGWDNPDGVSPVSSAIALLDATGQGKRFFVYEGWSDMEAYGYPPSRRKLRQYHRYNQGDFHDWHVDLVQQIKAERPEADVQLIPIAQILSEAFSDTGLADIPVTELYSDDAPHGTATLYFLAAAITYAAVFDSLPELGTRPASIHPLVETHFDAFRKIIQSRLPIRPAAQASADPQSTAPKAKATEAKPAPEAFAAAPNTAPSLGMGLNGISDWSTQQPFVNVMRSARPWIGHLPGQWGGWGHAELSAAGALDDSGWLTFVPEELEAVETVILTDLPKEATAQAGVYRLTYEGEGTLELRGRGRVQRYGQNEIWFHFTPGDGSVGIRISESDPNETGAYIRNIAVVHEDHIPLFEVGAEFNPAWLAHVQDLRLLRFMDWMDTNDSQISNWSERPKPTDYTFMWRGVPLETMLALSNRVAADPWFTLPHLADKDYITAFAQTVYQGLNPGLKAHVEYSNEVWNFIFEQARWADTQASEIWGQNGVEAGWMQLAGVKAAEMMQVFTRVFAEQPERLIRVAAVHTGWPGLENAFLEAPAHALRPVDYFDAYAVSGYFGHEVANDENAPALLDLIEEDQVIGTGYARATQRATELIRAGSLRFLTEEAWPHHARIAAQHNLQFIMYEGGTHVAAHGDWVNNEDMTAFLTAYNYTPEMAQLYQDLLAEWAAQGGRVFNAFVDVANPSKWGSWGALRYLNDRNERNAILRAFNMSGLALADTRPADAFAGGALMRGTDNADLLQGTPLADVMMGGVGDDALIAQGGDDLLHGGPGNDHATLKGFMEEYRFTRDGGVLQATSRFGTVRLYAIETLSFDSLPELMVSVPDFF